MTDVVLGNEVLLLRGQELMWREVDDEIVILDLRRSVYASVNATGRTLWLALSQGATEEQLAQQLQEQHGADPEVALRDARAFVAHLREQGMLA